MNAGDRFLSEVKRLQAEKGGESGAKFRRFVTSRFAMPTLLYARLFGEASPEAVEVTLEGLKPDRVAFFDDSGRDIPTTDELRFRVARKGAALVLYGALVGSDWKDSMEITID